MLLRHGHSTKLFLLLYTSLIVLLSTTVVVGENGAPDGVVKRDAGLLRRSHEQVDLYRRQDPPATPPPVSQPPVSQPPVAQPPVSQPPVSQPPISQPPVTAPPISQPPPAVTEPIVPGPGGSGPVTGPSGPTGPTVSGPTDPTITEPSGPTVTGPTVTGPTVTGPTVSGPTVSGPTVTEPTIAVSTITDPPGGPQPNTTVTVSDITSQSSPTLTVSDITSQSSLTPTVSDTTSQPSITPIGTDTAVTDLTTTGPVTARTTTHTSYSSTELPSVVIIGPSETYTMMEQENTGGQGGPTNTNQNKPAPTTSAPKPMVTVQVPPSDPKVECYPPNDWAPSNDVPITPPNPGNPTNSSNTGPPVVPRPPSSCNNTLVGSRQGSTIMYSFTGTSIQLRTVPSSDSGTFAVAVDSEPPVMIDGYAPLDSAVCNLRTTFARGGLSDGQHTIKVILTGSSPKSVGETKSSKVEFGGFTLMAPDPTASQTSQGPLIGGIVGGVVGGLLLIGLVAFFFVRRRRQAQLTEPTPLPAPFFSPPNSPPMTAISPAPTSVAGATSFSPFADPSSSSSGHHRLASSTSSYVPSVMSAPTPQPPRSPRFNPPSFGAMGGQMPEYGGNHSNPSLADPFNTPHTEVHGNPFAGPGYEDRSPTQTPSPLYMSRVNTPYIPPNQNGAGVGPSHMRSMSEATSTSSAGRASFSGNFSVAPPG